MTTTTEHAAPGSRASAAHRPETPLTAVTTATATGAAVPLTPRECADRRRAELRAFLRARRARVSPAEAGIAPGSRRRTPGLRREEVAVLAGVGVSWYQWLEQGRDITVSPSVLDAVGRVLRLNAAELRHLYVLAGLNPPLEVEERQQAPDAGLLRIMRDWMPKPAHLCDRYWNLLAWNDAAGLLFGWNARGENCLVSFFTDPRFRVLYTEWEHLARHVVASYRAGMLPFLGDPEYDAVVERVAAASPSSSNSGSGTRPRRPARWSRRSSTHGSAGCRSRARRCAWPPIPTCCSRCTARSTPPSTPTCGDWCARTDNASARRWAAPSDGAAHVLRRVRESQRPVTPTRTTSTSAALTKAIRWPSWISRYFVVPVTSVRVTWSPKSGE